MSDPETAEVEGSSEYESEYETDSEEEEEEPQLKYQRLGGSVTEILKDQTASCLTVHDRFLALGTHQGIIHILDLNGNATHQFQAHSGVVNELSVDDSGEFVASASDDGKVIISSLYSDEKRSFSYPRPMWSVALEPGYARSKNMRYSAGGRTGQLVINAKGWFGAKDFVVHKGEGPVYAVKWSQSLIAWSNDRGVKVYDVKHNERISYIDRPGGSPEPGLYRSHLVWENESTLIIGWADMVKFGRVREKPLSDMTIGMPNKFIEIVAMFRTDHPICGIAPFNANVVVLLHIDGEPVESEDEEADIETAADTTVVDPAKEQMPLPETKLSKTVQRPELRILTRTNQEVSSDALSIHQYQRCSPGDYRLAHNPNGDNMFYVLSPRDIVIAKPRDLDDRVSWLLDRGRYEEALKTVEDNATSLRRHKLVDVGEQYLAHLMESGDFGGAAALCPQIFKAADHERWESWIFVFAKTGQLKTIGPFIPVKNPQLSQAVYEMVLNFFLKNDEDRFLRTVREWPSDLYNIQNIIAAVIDKQREQGAKKSAILLDALASLYTYNGQYDKTLDIYLDLKREHVFDHIEEYKLFESVHDKILLLMDFHVDKALKLLVNHTDEIPIPEVVKQLTSRPKLQHLYLHALFQTDVRIASDFHELQVSLYAEYDYSKLLPFLKQSNYYNLEKALEVATKRNLYPEMVFILGRMGNSHEALTLIIDKLGNVKEAIDFVETQNDPDLWEDLINHSLKKAEFVGSLLEHIGARIDPLKLISRIPEDMEVEGLRDKLVKIIFDYHLQMSLREGCKEVLKSDCVALQHKHNRMQRRGLGFSDITPCEVCGVRISNWEKSEEVAPEVAVFFCGHAYHMSCLESCLPGKGRSAMSCIMCRSGR